MIDSEGWCRCRSCGETWPPYTNAARNGNCSSISCLTGRVTPLTDVEASVFRLAGYNGVETMPIGDP